MTVSSAIASASFNWTGVETVFSPGFQALGTADVGVSWSSPLGGGVLVNGANFSVSLDGANNVSINVLTGWPAPPATIVITRNSTPLQIDAFQDGVPWSATVVEQALDLCALREQELQRDVNAAMALATLDSTSINNEIARAEAAEQNLADSIAVLAAPGVSALLGVADPSLLPIVLPLTAGTYWSDGGVLCVTPGGSNPLPIIQPALPGYFWSNGGVVCVS